MLQKSYKHISIVFLFGSVRRGPIAGDRVMAKGCPVWFSGAALRYDLQNRVVRFDGYSALFFAFRFLVSSVFFAGDSAFAAFALSFVAAA